MTDTPALTPAQLAELAALLMHYHAAGGWRTSLTVVREECAIAFLDAAPALIAAAQSLAAIQGTGDLADLAREYAPPHVPPCPVCGRLMSLFRYHSGSFYQCTLCVEEGRSHERIKTTLALPDPRVVAALAELAQARERIVALERQLVEKETH